MIAMNFIADSQTLHMSHSFYDADFSHHCCLSLNGVTSLKKSKITFTDGIVAILDVLITT